MTITEPRPLTVPPGTDPTRLVLYCSQPECGTQIVGYGFSDEANPPMSVTGPWLCLFCAAEAAKTRPADIQQAFTTSPVKPGSKCDLSSPADREPVEKPYARGGTR